MTRSGIPWAVDRDYVARRCDCCDMWEIWIGHTLLRFQDEGLRQLSHGLAQMRPPAEGGRDQRSIAVQLTQDGSVVLVFGAEDFHAFRRMVDHAVESMGAGGGGTFDHPWSEVHHA